MQRFKPWLIGKLGGVTAERARELEEQRNQVTAIAKHQRKVMDWQTSKFVRYGWSPVELNLSEQSGGRALGLPDEVPGRQLIVFSGAFAPELNEIPTEIWDSVHTETGRRWDMARVNLHRDPARCVGDVRLAYEQLGFVEFEGLAGATEGYMRWLYGKVAPDGMHGMPLHLLKPALLKQTEKIDSGWPFLSPSASWGANTSFENSERMNGLDMLTRLVIGVDYALNFMNAHLNRIEAEVMGAILSEEASMSWMIRKAAGEIGEDELQPRPRPGRKRYDLVDQEYAKQTGRTLWRQDEIGFSNRIW